MNRRIRKKNAALYLKQGVLSLILLGLAVYLGAASSFAKTLFPVTVEQLSELEADSFIKKHPVIHLHLDKLYYTGYDNQSKEKVTGHYYYALEDNRCLFLLIDKQTDPPKDILYNYDGIFRIAEESGLYLKLTRMLAKDMEWSSKSMQAVSLPMVASQPDYHYVSNILLAGALCLGSLVFFLSAVSSFCNYFRCRHHHSLSPDP